MPYRVFISYAHNDDAPPPDGGGKGFVSTLMRYVAFYVKQNGPPMPSFFRDIYEIRKSTPFNPVLQGELQQADALLIVLSRNWLASEYCKHELSLFRSNHPQERPQDVQQRIIIVGKQFIAAKDFPQLLQNLDRAGDKFQDGHAFYEELDERPGMYEDYFAEGKRDQPAEFNRAAKDLANDLSARAAVCAGDPSPVQMPVPPASNGRKIFLAKPAGDMSEAYDRMVAELENQGYEVAPDPPARVSDVSEALIQGALQGAEVSIHLLGEKVGPAPEDEDHILPLQLHLAAARVAAQPEGGRFRRIIWAPRSMPGNGDAKLQRDPIEVVKRYGALDGDTIEGCEMGDFVEFVTKHLGDNPPPPPPPPQVPDPVPGDRNVYILANERDAKYAIAVGSVLQSKCNPTFAVYEDDQEGKEYNDGQLATCDEVLIPWADAGTVWVRSNASRLKNYRELGRDKPFERRTVVAGPPSGNDKAILTSVPPRDSIDVALDLTDYPTVPPNAFDSLFPEKPAQ
jgi:hypothetical protein